MDLTQAKPGMIAVHRNGGKSVITAVQGSNIYIGPLILYTKTGMYYSKEGVETHPFDIIGLEPAPEPLRVEGWVNVYENTMVGTFASKEEADMLVGYNKRIDCRHITYIEGKGIVDITEK